MEAESGTPLKICPHCSVASRTDADTCPSCGKPYGRRRLRWSWWFAIPIVVASFLLGLFVIGDVVNDVFRDDDSDAAGTITRDEAETVETGGSHRELVEDLGTSPAEETQRGSAGECLYYVLADESEAVWEFCFVENRLVSSREVPE
jgi:hypothetical protein